MTGPEHYRAAEQLLADVSTGGFVSDGTECANTIAAAQVHATLALAAATALGVGGDNPPDDDAEAWWRAAGTRSQGGDAE